MHRSTHTLWALFLLSSLKTAQPCIHHLSSFDPGEAIAINNAARQYPMAAASRKIALDNVRVFDGQRILPPSTVVIDGAIIGIDAQDAEHIDGKNHILLPGFIDSHCHPNTVEHLRQMGSHGITTGFVQSVTSLTLRDSLKNHDGLTDLRFSSQPAAVAGHSSQVPPGWHHVDSPEAARAFIANQAWRSVVLTFSLFPKCKSAALRDCFGCVQKTTSQPLICPPFSNHRSPLPPIKGKADTLISHLNSFNNCGIFQ